MVVKKISKTKILLKFLSGHFIVLFLFLSTFLIYVNGICPGVFAGDSGDFLSAIISKGVPHPSGYPLYILLGITFNSLPLGHTVAWRVGLISSLFASLSIILTYLISLTLTKNKIISIIISLILAFIYPFWIYAEVAEVFSLHFFFILLISLITIKFIISKENRLLYPLSFFLGLSLTNNMTVLLMFPAVGLSVLFTDIKILNDLKLIFTCIFLFILGMLPYLYIPIAAAQNPIVNWDRAVTAKNLLYLILRKAYGWIDTENRPFMFVNDFHSYYIYWKEYLNPIIPFAFVLGVIYFLKQKRRLLLFYLLTALFFIGPFYIFYAKVETKSLANISTIERFYIPSVIFLLLFSGPGILLLTKLLNKIIKRRPLYRLFYPLTLAAFALVPISYFIANYPKTDLSDIYIGNNLAKDVLGPLENKSFLFVDNDEFAFNTLYIQLEENFRPDITIPGRNTGFEKFLVESGTMNPDQAKTYLIKNRNTIDQETLYSCIVNLIRRGDNIYSTVPRVIVNDQDKKLGTIPHGLVYHFVVGAESVPKKEDYVTAQDEIYNNFLLGEYDSYK